MENRIALEFSEAQNCFHFNDKSTNRVEENTNGYVTISKYKDAKFYLEFIEFCRYVEKEANRPLRLRHVVGMWNDFVEDELVA